MNTTYQARTNEHYLVLIESLRDVPLCMFCGHEAQDFRPVTSNGIPYRFDLCNRCKEETQFINKAGKLMTSDQYEAIIPVISECQPLVTHKRVWDRPSK